MTGLAQMLPVPEKTGSISGRVVGAASGRPIAGAYLFGGRANSEIQARSDSAGAFLIEHLQPGRYQVMLYDPDSKQPIETKVIALAPGAELKGVVFRVPDPAVISGKVLDSEDEPVVGLRAAVFERGQRAGVAYTKLAAASVTNDLGEFRVAGLSPGRNYLLASFPDHPQPVFPRAAMPSADDATATPPFSILDTFTLLPGVERGGLRSSDSGRGRSRGAGAAVACANGAHDGSGGAQRRGDTRPVGGGALKRSRAGTDVRRIRPGRLRRTAFWRKEKRVRVRARPACRVRECWRPDSGCPMPSWW
jgi:hypothetical protein